MMALITPVPAVQAESPPAVVSTQMLGTWKVQGGRTSACPFTSYTVELTTPTDGGQPALIITPVGSHAFGRVTFYPYVGYSKVKGTEPNLPRTTIFTGKTSRDGTQVKAHDTDKQGASSGVIGMSNTTDDDLEMTLMKDNHLTVDFSHQDSGSALWIGSKEPALTYHCELAKPSARTAPPPKGQDRAPGRDTRNGNGNRGERAE